MKLIIFFFLFSVSIFPKNLNKLKSDLNDAKTNLEMKKISKKITISLKKELKNTVLKIKKEIKGEQLKSFIRSQENWKRYFESEDVFLIHEFSQRDKHGTSASLTSRNKKNQLIEFRLKYLKSLLDSI